MAGRSDKSEKRKPESGRDQIEENLKRVYDETLQEPLPDRLAELLEKIRKQGQQ